MICISWIHFYAFFYPSVNIFISTGDNIAEKPLLFKIFFVVVIFNLLIILLWTNYKYSLSIPFTTLGSWWWGIVIVGWLIYEQLTFVFPERTIIRKPLHHYFPICQSCSRFTVHPFGSRQAFACFPIMIATLCLFVWFQKWHIITVCSHCTYSIDVIF